MRPADVYDGVALNGTQDWKKRDQNFRGEKRRNVFLMDSQANHVVNQIKLNQIYWTTKRVRLQFAKIFENDKSNRRYMRTLFIGL